MLDIDLIVAARPNFMKIAPLYHALERESWCRTRIVHTGQHYDANMSDAFIRDLGLPDPHLHLGVGSGHHAEQLGGVMIAYERALADGRPNWIVVVGDVNSTAACSMVGAKLWIPVIHLEAGLRSRDRRMPEEINRLVTDAIADVLWTPSADADENLLAEGVPAERIDRVGNIMIDSYELMRARIDAAGTRASLGLNNRGYGVVTLHRPSNVDDAGALGKLVDGLVDVAGRLPLVFPLHPRTGRRLADFGLMSRFEGTAVRICEPLPYIEFMNLVSGSALAITDSGGVQEETTYLGIPCITLRDNTERPITLTEGTNRLSTAARFVAVADEALNGDWPTGRKPALWDGRTAPRCVAALRRRCGIG
ncbi:MAG: non-hydrolyzing UDP-N-acetylglucosamine 2-epimerase [Steroidobacteraceae bacterium]